MYISKNDVYKHLLYTHHLMYILCIHVYGPPAHAALREPRIAPVLTHLVVNEVLIDCCQFSCQNIIQRLNDRSITLHFSPTKFRLPRSLASCVSHCRDRLDNECEIVHSL